MIEINIYIINKQYRKKETTFALLLKCFKFYDYILAIVKSYEISNSIKLFYASNFLHYFNIIVNEIKYEGDIINDFKFFKRIKPHKILHLEDELLDILKKDLDLILFKPLVIGSYKDLTNFYLDDDYSEQVIENILIEFMKKNFFDLYQVNLNNNQWGETQPDGSIFLGKSMISDLEYLENNELLKNIQYWKVLITIMHELAHHILRKLDINICDIFIGSKGKFKCHENYKNKNFNKFMTLDSKDSGDVWEKILFGTRLNFININISSFLLNFDNFNLETETFIKTFTVEYKKDEEICLKNHEEKIRSAYRISRELSFSKCGKSFFR